MKKIIFLISFLLLVLLSFSNLFNYSVYIEDTKTMNKLFTIAVIKDYEFKYTSSNLFEYFTIKPLDSSTKAVKTNIKFKNLDTKYENTINLTIGEKVLISTMNYEGRDIRVYISVDSIKRMELMKESEIRNDMIELILKTEKIEKYNISLETILNNMIYVAGQYDFEHWGYSFGIYNKNTILGLNYKNEIVNFFLKDTVEIEELFKASVKLNFSEYKDGEFTIKYDFFADFMTFLFNSVGVGMDLNYLNNEFFVKGKTGLKFRYWNTYFFTGAAYDFKDDFNINLSLKTYF
ncbi:MAG: hypothetical protein ACQESN_09875 [Thermotogota bacterium]